MTEQEDPDRQRKLDLLDLSRYLDQRRKWQYEIVCMEATLEDPDYAIDHPAARERIKLANHAIELCNQLIAVQLDTLRIKDDREEFLKQIEALQPSED